MQGDKRLLESVSFGIDSGDKVALIGINGSGKTTLLNMIAGCEPLDSGQISRNNELKISMLAQTPPFDPQSPVLEHVFKCGGEKIELIKRYEHLNSQIGKSYDQSLQNEIDAVTEKMNGCGAWHFEGQVKSILEKLSIFDLEKKMGELSGGMLKKVSLAASLINECNLLILDEPTNHLDIATVEWLEQYLRKTDKALIMVTHDRYFLDRVCNRIIEIEKLKIIQYGGNYSYYLEKKAEIINSELVTEQRNKTVLKNELKWLGRGAKARSTKQKARIERIEKLRSNVSLKEEEMDASVLSERRLGKKILELKDISKSYGGKKIINPFSYVFKKGERIGIIGPNGSGKTTFLNLISRRIESDSGEIDTGVNTAIGYFDQYSSALDGDSLVIDFAKKSGEFIQNEDNKYIHVSEMLERFLFPPELQYSKISKLSGGERRRLYLLHVLLQNPNFLIFDEPTNDLDIKTLAILEDFLDEFKGCLITVSHDRYFMDRLAQYLFVFDGSGDIMGFAGNFSDYLEYSRQIEEEEKKNAELKAQKNKEYKQSTVPSEKKKLSFNEKKEYESILGEIEKLENEKAELEALFNSGENSADKLSGWTRRYDQLQHEIAFKIQRWEYLEDIAQK
ncbi:MAG: ABC transporter ATP-binding protein uup [bacterium ADurb.Bin243]|nr:MAG: ABC transporter ATP-binding protein uup [bacterium ADurb.Bin243]